MKKILTFVLNLFSLKKEDIHPISESEAEAQAWFMINSAH